MCVWGVLFEAGHLFENYFGHQEDAYSRSGVYSNKCGRFLSNHRWKSRNTSRGLLSKKSSRIM